MELTKELKTATDAALKAGEVITSYYGESLHVRHKSKEQPVTKADLESNHILKKILLKTFPDDGWLSEEDLDTEDRRTRQRVWIVDPLDGTKDFLNKNPEFAISIGLAIDKQAVLGVVYNPITRELFHAVRNQGAFRNQKRIAVKEPHPTELPTLVVSRSEYNRGEWDPYKDFFKISSSGGCAYKMAKIAEGQADGTFTLNPRSEWDVCAGHVLIEEAGGIVTRLSGNPILYNQENPLLDGIIYCNAPAVHTKILSSLQTALG